MPKVTVLNRSTVLTDDQAGLVTAALQVQVSRDFEPAWELGAELIFVGASGVPDPGTYWLVLLDDADQAGVLGYHDLGPSGQPMGKAFLKTTVNDGGIPSVVISHELLEMLADPWINRSVAYQDSDGRGMLYCLEVCDATEDDQWAYDINGVTVSDFCYPSWWDGWRAPRSAQFDHRDKIIAPFELLPGGYIGAMSFSGGGWQQLTADKVHKSQLRPHVGQRRERRHLPRNFWRHSVPTK